MRTRSIGHRLVALFAMGCLFFNAPLLSIFDRPVNVWGIPLLYLYVFGAWLFLIVAIAWISEGR
ncbi:hypothetical protein [Cognatazoarcus halotolerans]|uniref:hypothetical protein n=1 Tax=Cognatazoarcus halotolerans TaxID=2686016 RepID=UPI00135B4A4E|nr:hypothetical protein [Cognatazoarcus halotolerans]MBX3679360.1 hypothetical protein [Rhodocyclaceae bacterium]MCB1899837.1 hypothetical protein [Rhodocyclaceae bacterium]MCP5309355.1 hypothetical protein [Zoogloeaceae bacterium]